MTFAIRGKNKATRMQMGPARNCLGGMPVSSGLSSSKGMMVCTLALSIALGSRGAAAGEQEYGRSERTQASIVSSDSRFVPPNDVVNPLRLLALELTDQEMREGRACDRRSGKFEVFASS